jgi:hypothetical protein
VEEEALTLKKEAKDRLLELEDGVKDTLPIPILEQTLED